MSRALLLLLVPALPLGAAAFGLWQGRRRPEAVGWAVAGASLGSLLAGAVLGPAPLQVGTTWLTVGPRVLTVGLRLDGLAWAMALLVAGVSSAVHLYAVAYGREESARGRLHTWLAGFTAAMLVLVLADSLVLLFAAWEMVGLASWALISHRRKQAVARRAGRLAFVITRLADGGFLVAWLVAWAATGTTALDPVLETLAARPSLGAGVAGLLLVAALGKSAQLPFSAWLPAAMAGPTPVSALLHSATMVAAGVFLVLRTWPLFEGATPVLAGLRWGGAITAVVAALAATAAGDLKRLLAWSTVSQLGEMMLALGLGGPLAAAFHLGAHATFKAPLFLAAGTVEETQGTRRLAALGGLVRRLPGTAVAFALAAAALAGLPPLAGWFSGDHLLKDALHHGGAWPGVVPLLLGLAALYIGRAFAAVFLGATPEPPGEAAPSPLLVGPALALAAVAAVAGLASRPLEDLLGFRPPEGSVPLAWTVLLGAAPLLGGGLGIWRGLQARARPALGQAVAAPARWVEGLPGQVAAATGVLARWVDRGEGWLDAGARALARGMGLASVGAQALARRLDRAEVGAARMGEGAARLSARLDDRGVSDALDAGVGVLLAGAGRLRRLQSGRLTFYTLGIFVSALALVLASFLWWH